MNCWLLTDDLILTQQVSNALGSSWNVTPSTVYPASDTSIQAMIVDLNLGQIDCQTIAEYASNHAITLCAVASHVHVGKIEAAKEAGISHVLTRGQIASHLSSLLDT